MARRIIPHEYSEDQLAKYLLLGKKVKLCSNCKFLSNYYICLINDISIEKEKANKSACSNWEKVDEV